MCRKEKTTSKWSENKQIYALFMVEWPQCHDSEKEKTYDICLRFQTYLLCYCYVWNQPAVVSWFNVLSCSMILWQSRITALHEQWASKPSCSCCRQPAQIFLWYKAQLALEHGSQLPLCSVNPWICRPFWCLQRHPRSCSRPMDLAAWAH